MTVSGHIVVVGSCRVDLLARVPRLPAPGETGAGSGLAEEVGGKGANQAVAARRLGAAVRLVARVGRDSRGDAILDALRAEGVDVTAVGRAPAATGVALVTVEEATGARTVVVVPGANHALLPDDVEGAAPLFAGAAVVVTQLEVPVDTAARALALGRRYGARTVLNPAPAVPLPGGLLPLADYLIPNERELARLVGGRAATATEIEAAARSLLASGPGEVIVTLGARGALRVTRLGSALEAPPEAVAVDTTGAGDAFVGAFAQGLAADLDPLAAVRHANHASALSVARPGARSSFARAEEMHTWRNR
ncbi:MAG TPA: ribokinase [Thermodesulfobacteriota bacterium]